MSDQSLCVHGVTFFNTQGRSWVATIGPFIVEVKPRTAEDKSSPDDNGDDWEWSVLVQVPKGLRLFQMCKSEYANRHNFGVMNGTERDRYDAMSMAAIAIRDELTIAMNELDGAKP
jgi:hypothetical protein